MRLERESEKTSRTESIGCATICIRQMGAKECQNGSLIV